jgi:CRP/FNR family transcriptional regulator, anaerobic regulatory protein
MENLFNFIGSRIEISAQLKEQLLKIIKIENFLKSTLIINQGEKIDRLYFSEKGIIRKFTNKYKNETTTYFLNSCNFFTCINALNKKLPSSHSFELISPGQLISVSFKDFFDLVQKFPSLSIVYNDIIENYYLLEEDRAIQLQVLSAKDRYENFLATAGPIMNYANLGDIANMLGMTQETLSRIRGKIKAKVKKHVEVKI